MALNMELSRPTSRSKSVENQNRAYRESGWISFFQETPAGPQRVSLLPGMDIREAGESVLRDIESEIVA